MSSRLPTPCITPEPDKQPASVKLDKSKLCYFHWDVWMRQYKTLRRVKILLFESCRKFKGTVFSWISFPQAPEYTIRAVSNFFENSRRYSQLKVHHWCRWHRWQMEKIFNHKSFNYFVWTPLGSRVNFYCSHYLPSVSRTLAKLVANLPPVSLILAAILPPVSLIPVVSLDLRIAPRMFKKFERSYWDTLGLGGNWFMNKTRRKKSRDTVPLKPATYLSKTQSS